MKILHTVESYLPDVNGMQEVVKQISERLAKNGHVITIATRFNPKRNSEKMNGVKIEQFKISGNNIMGYNAEDDEIKRYQNFIMDSEFDIITNFAAQQWATDLVLPLLKKIKAIKVFVPTGFSALFSDEYKEYFEKMKYWMKDYDMNIFLSNDYRDINFAKENGIEKRMLIPNGADEKEFLKKLNIDIKKYLKIPQKNLLILNVGSHAGLKGHYETIKIFKKAKIKNATLLIIGNGKMGCYGSCKKSEKLYNWSINSLINKKKIVIKEFPRDLTVSAYKAADIFLFPSNLECSPIVIYEACASKTPFLASDVGNIKEQIEWTKGGMPLPTTKGLEMNRSLEYKIRKFLKRVLKFAGIFKGTIIHIDYNFVSVDIDKSAEILEKLCKDKNLREELAKNGFESWQKNFTWQKIAEKYEQLYKSLI